MTAQSLVTAAAGSWNSNGCIQEVLPEPGQEGGMGRMGRGSSISSALAVRELNSPMPGILSGKEQGFAVLLTAWNFPPQACGVLWEWCLDK